MASVPAVDRPREKLARVGAEALGDNELVALVLGSGTRSRGALLVALDVIEAAGGVQGLVRIGLDELCRIPGVGDSRAAGLKAAVELGRRTLFGDREERPQMLSTGDIVGYLTPRYAGFGVERFGVMLLDQKQRVIRSLILSTGTIEASISHPRDTFRVAMLAQASFVVAFHNHPSGDPLPSVADRFMTRRLFDAGEVVGITLMDHIILGDDGKYFSFKAEGAD
jgi:DNA repair protein RadC